MDDGDRAGSSVSGIGDFNGDGFDDFLIGAPYADAGFGHGDGKAYLVLGGTDPSGTRALGDLDGSDGVPFFAVAAGDRAGQGVGAAGDINGDGFADAVITAPRAGYDGNTNVGATYVVFGHTTATGNGTFDLSDLSGSDGFVVKGVGANDYSGIAVSGGGDFNGDGFDDLLIGADPAPNLTFYGATYVVFGGSGVGASGLIELSDLDGSNGFTINGTAEEGRFGASVDRAGDVNGDGYEDFIIGDSGFDLSHRSNEGQAVVFGGPALGEGGTVDLGGLDGSNGFSFGPYGGYFPSAQLGYRVSAAGDVNADGFADVIVGSLTGVGNSYVVFGASDVGAGGQFDLLTLNGSNGFRLDGAIDGDFTATVSGVGDVNGDGIDDIAVGAAHASGGGEESGKLYVVHGATDIGQSGNVDGFQILVAPKPICLLTPGSR